MISAMRKVYLDKTKKGRRIRYIGIVSWFICIFLSIVLKRPDFLGAAGAVGICFLLYYVYVEQKEIRTNRKLMESMFGDTYKMVNSFTEYDYNKLSDQEKEDFNETSSDIGRNELDFEEGLEHISTIQLKLLVLLTLQWAFGTAIYDLGNMLLRTL